MGTHKGNCHICGRYTDLTYEHVPPRAALNHMPVKVFSGKEIIMQQQKKVMPDTDRIKYQKHQQGSGGYTLCCECNNNIGSYYANHYNNFINSLYLLLETYYRDYKNCETKVGDLYPKLCLASKNLNPLAIFKQIIAMFCSTSIFNTYQDNFREFLLNKESTTFDRNRWLVCIYINTGTRYGSTGLFTVILKNHEYLKVAEIVTLPLGIILYDLQSPCNIEPYLFGCGITDFSKLLYGSDQHIMLELPYNNGAKFMPGFIRK
jgi:hypothetical protein